MSKQAKGGEARAKKLTPEKRSEIAKKGAEARWGDPDKLPRETHPGELHIGDAVIQCSVLEDGTRVLGRNAMLRAFGLSKGGGRKKNYEPLDDGGAQIPRFLESTSIRSRLSTDLLEGLARPVVFRPKHGGRAANGYEATLLPKICNAILEARDAGALQQNQIPLAVQADMLIRALAQVGIIALIDEATGYQAERDRDELQRLLKLYLSEEALKWVKRFPAEFFNQIYRLRGWQRPMNLHAHSPQMGKYINELVYERLPEGVMDQLKKLNPVDDETKRRKYKHHQFLTEDVGHPDLQAHLIKLIGLMQASTDWDMFKQLFGRVFMKSADGVQQKLSFNGD